MDIFTSTERRISLQLLGYWEKLRGMREMPVEADIYPEHISELWKHCFVAHVSQANPGGYRYVYVGSAIFDANANGVSSYNCTDTLSLNTEKITASFDHVVQSRRPVMGEGTCQAQTGELIRFRQCFLPLGKNGNVEAIFGGMRYKSFPHY